jgi:hypothetical protein
LAVLPIAAMVAIALALDIAEQARLPGRYLLPSLPAVAVGCMAGWRALVPRAWRCGVWKAISVGVIATGWAIPFVTLGPAYAKPNLLPSQGPIEHPLNMVFGDTVELIGYQSIRRAPDGESIEVDLCWQAARTMRQNYSVQLEVVGTGGMPVARLETWPGHGNYPTSLWRLAAPFCDAYRIPIRGNYPVPKQSSIRLAIVDGVGGARLPVETLAGKAVGYDVLIPWSP